MNFRLINTTFAVLHLATTIVQIAIVGNDQNVVPYVDGFVLTSLSVAIHCIAFISHIVFTIFGTSIVQSHIQINKQNPFRWFTNCIIEPIFHLLIFLILGEANVVLLLLVVIASFAISGFGHLQDMKVIEDNKQPVFHPSFFATTINLTINGLTMYYMYLQRERLKENKHFFGLVVVLVMMTWSNFIIQSFYTKRTFKHKLQHAEDVEHSGESEEMTEELKNNLDDDVHSNYRVLKYELIYYTASLIKWSILSWACLYITKKHMEF